MGYLCLEDGASGPLDGVDHWRVKKVADFPQKAIMPGVLILEALAQTGAIAILSMPENKGKLAVFGGVKNCRFKRPVVPGDVLTLECELTNMRGGIGFGNVTASVDGEIAASGEISFAIIDA